ncbi:MAG: hypothetical protein KAQ85_00855 [Thermodesulfovibrionia bacterium]|nr:hypothetical protein [Thermodesulfovibrionia bacterium]
MSTEEKLSKKLKRDRAIAHALIGLGEAIMVLGTAVIGVQPEKVEG